MKVFANYTTDKFPMVTSNDPAKKDEGYCTRLAQAAYAQWYAGMTGTTYAMTEKMDLLRAYGDGEQSEDIYKEYVNRGFSDDSGTIDDNDKIVDVEIHQAMRNQRSKKRKGYYNVLWKVISPANKVRNALVGSFLKMEYNIECDPIDDNSKDLVENEKSKAWFMKETADFNAKFSKVAKVPIPDPQFTPESKDELDLYEQMGGFKPRFSMHMETLIKHSMDESDFNEIKKKLMMDATDLAIFGVKNYYDPRDGKMRIRYVNPRNLIIQYSDYGDFRDSDYAGEFIFVTVGELRSLGFGDEFLRSVARSNCGFYGNPGLYYWGKYNKLSSDGVFGWEFFKVLVFDFQWKDVDSRKELVWTNRYKQEKVKLIDLNDPDQDTKNGKTRIVDKQRLYGCKWIVGTERSYGYGPVYDVTKPTKKDVELQYHMCQLLTKSTTEQLMPIYDAFMNTWIKYQNAKAMAVNQGYAIDYDAIKNLKLGGKKYSEEAIIRRFLQSGVLIFKNTNAQGQRNTSGVPVMQLPGGMGKMFDDVMKDFKFLLSMMENLTGLNPVTLGSSPDPNAPVKTTEYAISASSNIIYPTIDGYLGMKARMAAHAARYIQLLIKFYPESKDAYAKVIGNEGVAMLQDTAGDSSTFGISIIAKPSDEQSKLIYQSAMESLKNGRDGKPGINEADFFTIMHIIESGGSLKMAELVLNDRIRKAQKAFSQQQQQNMQAQAQFQSQQATQAEQMKLMAYAKKMQIDMLADKQRHIWKMEELAISAKLDIAKEYLLKESPLNQASPAGGPPTQDQGAQPGPGGPAGPQPGPSASGPSGPEQDGGPDTGDQGAQDGSSPTDSGASQ